MTLSLYLFSGYVFDKMDVDETSKEKVSHQGHQYVFVPFLASVEVSCLWKGRLWMETNLKSLCLYAIHEITVNLYKADN